MVTVVAAFLLFLTTTVLIQRFGNESLLLVFLVLALSAPVTYLIVDRMRQQNTLARLKEEALRAELASLQSQIDPHFFFNTLNNLYGLTVAGSPHAPEMILKLSALMRFTIYEGRKAHVPIEEELEYLNNYLALMKIRAKTGKVRVEFNTEIEAVDARVPPLMSVILIENAFKHGAATLTTGAWLRIDLRFADGRLDLRVKNNYDPENRQRGKGIGLTNLRRRLALRYPGPRHALELVDEDGTHTAELRIDCVT